MAWGREVEEAVVGVGDDGRLIIEHELEDAVRIDAGAVAAGRALGSGQTGSVGRDA